MKWYAIPIKYDLWFVFVLAGLSWAVIGGLYVYFAEPHLVLEERRISDEPEQIKVKYFAGDCGSDRAAICVQARFAESVWTDATNLKVQARYLVVPEGVPCPDKTSLAVEGNSFLLSGYRYAAQERNRITGNARDETSSRIDVVAWEAEAPYSALGGATADRTVTENLHEPVSYATTAKDHSPDSFSMSEDQSERATDSCIEVPS